MIRANKSFAALAEALITSAALGVPHGFLTAQQSAAQRFALVSPDAQPVFVKQVHSALALSVNAPFSGDSRPQVDAIATNRGGLMLGIVTADCAPVLLADTAAGVIGAAHAGWRGAHGGVLEAVVAEMEALGARAENIAAVIGPAIAKASYEVDAGFRKRFTAQDEIFFSAGREGHFQFDLEAYAAARLTRAGIATVDCLGIDTYTQAENFHSYRRATHRDDDSSGRQFSMIALPS